MRKNKDIFSLGDVDRTTSCRKSMRTHPDEWQPLFYLIYVTRKKRRDDRLTYKKEEKKTHEGLSIK
jgi:hypothetical protein